MYFPARGYVTGGQSDLRSARFILSLAQKSLVVICSVTDGTEAVPKSRQSSKYELSAAVQDVLRRHRNRT